MQNILKIDSTDTLIVALKDLKKGEKVSWDDEEYVLKTDVKAKHKFATREIPVGGVVSLYGVPVGKAIKAIAQGAAVTVDNIKHFAAPVSLDDSESYQWDVPDVSEWKDATFKGIIRGDGRVGTANYWLVFPLVFCENRNVQKVTDALNEALGYADNGLKDFAHQLAASSGERQASVRPFPHLDGVRCFTVTSGCGGATSDSMTMCDVLAAYADHPNVAGVTVFALGCEKARIVDFKAALKKRNPDFSKEIIYFRQQDWDSEEKMMRDALKATYGAIQKTPVAERVDVPLSHLKLGVKCGASDGFSGISANPAMGLVSDWLVALGGASGLAEFPELCGAEGDIVKRCMTRELKEKFLSLMKHYEHVANFFDTSISDNPSPGNIADGLITDAIKSAGAAKKGGRAPVSAVCDYAEPMAESGLSLVCTPGNDVLAVTGLVAAGCNAVIFSTGLGTPTGNPIVPVLKISTNSAIAKRLVDMIDYDCGPIIDGTPLPIISRGLFKTLIEAASGSYKVKADRLEQSDFMLWKRSLDL
ncbi:altronate dehydratase [Sodalis ligni]|uniref:UxaA family hydrolase n=1 Tax=Sodalis ligni TaxID=2697027 RepID=UPI00193EDCC9|nr:altronate dehydratase family protein [Sodalis ligni]QWA13141.1 altronate dehydratase [Sodalis ligni]